MKYNCNNARSYPRVMLEEANLFRVQQSHSLTYNYNYEIAENGYMTFLVDCAA